MVVAGEASGDLHGAGLVRALRQQRDHLRFLGIGGPRLRAEGMELVADSSTWGLVGLPESAGWFLRVWRGWRRARQELSRRPPRALVLIDFGWVNMSLARAARSCGVPVLYFFPPQSWSRNPTRTEVADIVDAVATPFPWSAERLRGRHARVEWVGHPLRDIVQVTESRSQAAARLGLDPGRRVMALAPGSRPAEIRHILPPVAGAAALLAKEFPDLQFLVPVAPTVARETVAAELARVGVSARLLDGVDYDALQLADVALVASGTVTLELALLGVPMIVVYRVSRFAALQAALYRRLFPAGTQGFRMVALPNLMAQRRIVPELLQDRATPELMAAEAGRLLRDAEARDRMRIELRAVAEALGPPGALERTAEMTLALLDERSGG